MKFLALLALIAFAFVGCTHTDEEASLREIPVTGNRNLIPDSMRPEGIMMQ